MRLEIWTDPGAALLALLLAGHFISDALLPPTKSGGDRSGAQRFLWHVLLVLIVQGFVALPFLGLPVALALIGLAIVHPAVRGLRVGRPASVGPVRLLAIRAVHAGIVLGVWWLLRALASPGPAPIAAEWLASWVTVAIVLAAFTFNAAGGSEVVAAVLGPLAEGVDATPARAPDASGRAGVGRLIGILERTLTLILILSGQWAAMALLATAKSVARFDDLKNREFAEYYLVGTLTSLLVAIVVGLGLRWLGF